MNTLHATRLSPFAMAGFGRDETVLADGRRVELSPVNPQDALAEQAFVGALSLTSRYRRFHFGLRELTPEQSRAMTEIDQHRHVLWGNPGMLALIRSLGASLRRVPGDATVVRAEFVFGKDRQDALGLVRAEA